MRTPKRVVVVGGGVAGLCCAYYLRKRDVDVVLLESESIGSRIASSYGNGGWICPAQAGPLPAPGLTIYGLRALVRADSALYFRPSHLPRLAPWLARFYSYCNPRDFERGTAALAALGKRVFPLVDEMVADGVECELFKMGFVCATAAEVDAWKALRSLDGMRRHGYRLPGELIFGDDLRALEPALNDRVTAGFLVEEQWHVRAHTFVDGLAAVLRRDSVEIVEGARVTGFDTANGVVRTARTTRGDFSGDAYVLAAGCWTQPLARTIGVRFPMEPGKGYTFMVHPAVMPRHGILFPDIHSGATPLHDRVRIGGTLEFSGYDLAIDRRRIETIFRLAKDYIDLAQPDYHEPWAGLRPLTPDGLPVIDWAQPYANAFIATGYSMLGMTLSQPSGEALAEMILGGERPPVLEPFRVDRFKRFLRRAQVGG